MKGQYVGAHLLGAKKNSAQTTDENNSAIFGFNHINLNDTDRMYNGVLVRVMFTGKPGGPLENENEGELNF
jgi:hypothetical protein